jgi:hypothetical protein
MTTTTTTTTADRLPCLAACGRTVAPTRRDRYCSTCRRAMTATAPAGRRLSVRVELQSDPARLARVELYRRRAEREEPLFQEGIICDLS